ncbi:putative membrane protein, partial [Mycolicibacterium hassiacum DSM 44199]
MLVPVVDMVLIALAGIGAGAINALVGSGTLVTFPTLVALGVAPVTATMSNAVGLVAGGV